MNTALMTELFRVPFMTGLVLTLLVSLMGAFLRLRDEWMAALGLPHLAAAGAMAGLPLGIPPAAGAALVTGAATLIKTALARAGNSHFALLLILGWAASLFLAANIQQGAVVGEGLLRGQLYFSRPGHLYTALVVLGLLLASFGWLNRRLLIQQFFPDHFSANLQAGWTHEAWFHVLLVATIVPGTLAMGALPLFALFFVPAWVAFSLARGWKQGMLLCMGIGLLAYLGAFFLAIALDQPFGPALALLLALTAGLRLLPALICRCRRN